MSSSESSADAGLDQLMRAACAAGFAMVSLEDEEAVAPMRAVVRNVEELARGGRQAVAGSNLPAVVRDRVAPGAKGLVSSAASSVRETVYGYLGLGVPA